MPHSSSFLGSVFASQLNAGIARHGFAVVPVGYGECSVPGCCAPLARHPWTYTVGLSQSDHPELVLMGLDPVTAHLAISYVASAARSARPIPLEQPFELAGRSLKVVEVPEEWLLTDPDRMAGWFDERSRHARPSGLPTVRQVLWADEEGRFPDDLGCPAALVRRQPMLRDDPFSVPHLASATVRNGRHPRRRAS